MPDPYLFTAIVVLVAFLLFVRRVALGFAHYCKAHCENVSDGASGIREHTEGTTL